MTQNRCGSPEYSIRCRDKKDKGKGKGDGYRPPSPKGPPSAKGGGKAQPKGDGNMHVAKAPDGTGLMYCWFFHHAPSGCKWGKSCSFSHQAPKKDVLDAMLAPKSRSPSPRKGGGKGKKGGKSPTGSKDNSPSPKGAGKGTVRYCHKFQTGDCTYGDACRFAHQIKPDGSAPPSPKAGKKKAKEKAAPSPTPDAA